MSNLELSRRQLFRGGLATLIARNFGLLEVGARAGPSLVPAVVPLSPFGAGSSDTLTQMIVDLMDEESMHPQYFARSAVRRILNEAAQPGADAKQVISKYFGDDAIASLPGPIDLFSEPSSIIDSSRAPDVAGDSEVIRNENVANSEFESDDAGDEVISSEGVV